MRAYAFSFFIYLHVAVAFLGGCRVAQTILFSFELIFLRPASLLRFSFFFLFSRTRSCRPRVRLAENNISNNHFTFDASSLLAVVMRLEVSLPPLSSSFPSSSSHKVPPPPSFPRGSEQPTPPQLFPVKPRVLVVGIVRVPLSNLFFSRRARVPQRGRENGCDTGPPPMTGKCKRGRIFLVEEQGENEILQFRSHPLMNLALSLLSLSGGVYSLSLFCGTAELSVGCRRY